MGNHHHHTHHEHDNSDKTLKEKLSILLHHWKEHNAAHLEEYEKWQKKASEEGLIDVEELLKEVCKKVSDISELYNEIEKIIG